MVNFLDKIKTSAAFAKAGKGEKLGSSSMTSNDDNKKNEEIIDQNKSNFKKSKSETNEDNGIVFYQCWICENSIEDVEFQNHMNKCSQEYEEKVLEQNIESELIVKLFKTLNSSEKINDGLLVISKSVRNIINNPDEAKFRKLRLENKTIKEKVSALRFGLCVYIYLGFREKVLVENNNDIVMEYSSGSNIEELSQKLTKIENIHLLKPCLFSRNEKIIDEKESKKNRKKQNDLINDDFFEFNSKDLSDEYSRVANKSQLDQLLVSAKTKETIINSKVSKPIYKISTLRIKFPDMKTLQAEFLPSETIKDLFSFIHSIVHHPNHKFTLVSLHNRKEITEADFNVSLEQAGFHPKSLFHLRWDDLSKNSFIKKLS